MSKSLMILGGSGYFGKTFLSSFVDGKLLKYNISKLILVSRKNKYKNNKFKKKIFFLKKDLSTAKNLPYADYIIYGAEYVDAQKILSNYKSKKDLKTFNNVFNNILSKKKFKKTKIIYLSSGSVYLNRNSKIRKKIDEKGKIFTRKFHSLTKFSEIYTNNKIIGEEMTKNLSIKYGIKTSIARCFAQIGPHLPLNKQYIIGNFIYSILKNKPLKIFEKSSVSVFRSFMYADDLVSWLLKILKSSSLSTPIYNVGSDKPISIWSLGKYFEKKFKIKFLFPKQKKNFFDFYIPSIKKAKRNLSLKINYNLSQSILLTLKKLGYYYK